MSYCAMITELCSPENDLILLSVMLVFSPGMFESRSPGYYKLLCQTGNGSVGQTHAEVPMSACANWCFDQYV